MLRVRAFATVGLLTALTLSAKSQTNPATGLYRFGSFDSRGFDTINIGNLNTHFEIPIVEKAGRGINFDYRIVYDGLIWSPTSSSGAATFTPDPDWGFRGQLNGGLVGYLTYRQATGFGAGGGACPRPPNYSGQVPTSTTDHFVYHDPYGVSHPFHLSIKACPLSLDDPTITGDGSSSDGSGYKYDINDGYVHTITGSTLQPPVLNDSTSGKIIDSNGNYVTNNGNGTFTDSLGVTALTISGGGNASSPRIFTYNVARQTDGSTTATVTMSYHTYTVATNFGCTNSLGNPIGNYGPLQNDLLDRITLADGTYYQFNYEDTLGVSGAKTGRLASVTLPTGGTITYQYSDGCNGNGLNADGTTGSLKRVTSDGTRSYTRAVSTNGSTTTLEDESGNQTLYTFTNAGGLFYETHHTVHSGNTSSPVLEDVSTCYNNETNCDGVAISTPILVKTVLSSHNSGGQLKTIDIFNSSGLLTSEQRYDYGGALLQTTAYGYVAPGRISSVIVTDNSNHTLSQQTYNYDEQTPATTSNLPQHSAVSSARGNLTSAHILINAAGATADSVYTYDDAGQALTAKDARLNTTTYAYDPATDAFLIQTTYPIPGNGNNTQIVTHAQYDVASGILLSTIDPNNQTTAYQSYDRLLRPTEIDYPDGGKTLYSYLSATEQQVSVLQQGNIYQTMTYDTDGYGRQSKVTRNDPTQGDISVEYGYTNGLLHSVANPHRSSAASTDGTTFYDYDALGRTTKITLPDNNTQQFSYNDNTVTKYNETGKQWKYTTDGLGRLTQVIEPNNPEGDGSIQGMAETDYSYSDLTTTVSQKGIVGVEASRPNRTFTADLLGRTVSVNEPESGVTTYGYDNNGNLKTSTNSLGITTNYDYDSLNRLTHITYSNGTPGRWFGYDITSSWMGPQYNTIGRLAQATTDTDPYYAGSVPNPDPQYAWTDELYSYDAMGRANRIGTTFPSESGHAAHEIDMTYDLAGNMSSLRYPDGRVITQGFDGGGHLQNVVYDNWNGQHVGYTYASAFTYTPAGAQTEMTFGNGPYVHTPYNNRQQMCQVWSHSFQGWIDTHIYYGSEIFCNNTPNNNGTISEIKDWKNSNRTQYFSYDNLNRVTLFHNGNSSMNQSYSYDSFGNLKQAGTLGSPNCCDSNNRINDSGYDINSAGNLTHTNVAGVNSYYAYDGAGRLLNVNSGSGYYTYAANGNRVRKDFDGTHTEYQYLNGVPIAEKHADGTWSDYIYANGQKIARADSYDARIHFTGTNCANCGPNATAYNIPLPAYTIQAGDKISWRQFQTGAAIPRGGVGIRFSDDVYTNWQTYDQDGQIMNSDATQNSWHFRTVDLSQYAGKTIAAAWINADAQTGAGHWEEYFSDIAFYRTDGTVVPIYHRQTGVSYPYFGYGNVTDRTFEAQINLGDALNPALSTTYYIGDQIASTRMIFSGGGWPVESSTFYPFGQEEAATASPDHYKFADLERDGESGLDHATFRQYSSTMGRWMSPDPYLGSYDFANPQSLNRYTYARNNPLIVIDPTGLSGVCVNVFPYGTAEGYQYSVDPWINNSADCSAAYGTWQETGSDVTVDVDSGPIADPGLGAIAVPPSGSPSSGGGGGTGTSNGAPAPSKPGQPKEDCSQLLKGAAVTVGLDAAGTFLGAVPGSGAVLVGLQVGVGFAGAANSAYHGDVGGTMAGTIGGAQLSAIAAGSEQVGWTALKTFGGTVARAVPVVGSIISAGYFYKDATEALDKYQACKAGVGG